MTTSQDGGFEFLKIAEEHLQSIEHSCFKHHSTKIKKLLWFAFLDTLHLSCTGSRTRSKYDERAAFLKSHCLWGDCSRVCIPILLSAVEQEADDCFRTTNNFAKSIHDTFPGLGGDPLSVDRDPELENVLTSTGWGKDTDGRHLKLGTRNPEDFTHCHIFFKDCRNSLIHSLWDRNGGNEKIFDEQIQPYYDSRAVAGGYSWFPVYPEGFMSLLAKNALNSIRTDVEADRIDPLNNLQSENRDRTLFVVPIANDDSPTEI